MAARQYPRTNFNTNVGQATMLKQPWNSYARSAAALSEPATHLAPTLKGRNAGRRTRHCLSAFICILLLATQALFAHAALAQTKIQDPGNPPDQGNNPLLADDQETPYKPFVPIVDDSADIDVSGGSYNAEGTMAIDTNMNDRLKRDNPFGFAEQGHQPKPFTTMETAKEPSTGYGRSIANILAPEHDQDSLALQSTERQQNNPQSDMGNLESNCSKATDHTDYRGCAYFANDDIIGNLFGQIGQLIGKWLTN